MNESIDRAISNRALELISGEYEAKEAVIKSVDGGYSRNRRAIVSLGEEEIFLKEVDVSLLPDEGETELSWLKKDYDLVKALKEYVPELVPEWAKLTMNGHLLILPSYSQDEGWLWTLPTESSLQKQYINKVVSATRELEAVKFSDELIDTLSLQPYFRDKLANDDSIIRIITDKNLKKRLIEKYRQLVDQDDDRGLQKSYQELLSALESDTILNELKIKTIELGNQMNDCFNHCDVRSDNIAFNKHSGALKFVDWNWASFAPSKFGSTEFLVDMARLGVDVTPWLNDLNPELLASMVGLYVVKSLDKPFSPTNNLRQMQTETGAVAYHLYSMVQ